MGLIRNQLMGMMQQQAPMQQQPMQRGGRAQQMGQPQSMPQMDVNSLQRMIMDMLQQRNQMQMNQSQIQSMPAQPQGGMAGGLSAGVPAMMKSDMRQSVMPMGAQTGGAMNANLPFNSVMSPAQPTFNNPNQMF